MQVSTDLLIWNDAHMQSRAKIQYVAVLTRKIVNFNFCEGFLEGFFHLRHQVRNKIDDLRFVAFSATGLPKPGLDSPGLSHRTVEPYATSLPMPGHLGNAIARCLSWIYLAFDVFS